MAADIMRPTTWDEYIGQTATKSRLETHIDSALIREAPLENVFLYGPPGAGKTSLGSLIADSMVLPFEYMIMPIPSKVLARVISNFEGVLMLDEIHRASTKQQEELLPLIEFGYFMTPSGYRVETGHLTIIGATTERTDVIKPLRERFPIRPHFDDYTDDEMAKIVMGMGRKIGIDFAEAEAKKLGMATGGIPRNARQFVLAARDLGLSNGEATAKQILDFCRVTPDGLTLDHIEYLRTLKKALNPVGLTTLSDVLGHKEADVRELERLLMDKEYVIRTDRGRELAKAGQIRAREIK